MLALNTDHINKKYDEDKHVTHSRAPEEDEGSGAPTKSEKWSNMFFSRSPYSNQLCSAEYLSFKRS